MPMISDTVGISSIHGGEDVNLANGLPQLVGHDTNRGNVFLRQWIDEVAADFRGMGRQSFFQLHPSFPCEANLRAVRPLLTFADQRARLHTCKLMRQSALVPSEERLHLLLAFTTSRRPEL